MKVSAATVTRKCNQAVPKSKVKCKSEHKLHWAKCWLELLRVSTTAGIMDRSLAVHRELGSRSSASKIQNVEGLRSQHHSCQHMKQGDSFNKGKEPARRDQKLLCYYWTYKVGEVPWIWPQPHTWAGLCKPGSFELMLDLIRGQFRPNFISALPGTDCPLGTTNPLLPASSPRLWALCELWHRQCLVQIKRPLQPLQPTGGRGRIQQWVRLCSCFPPCTSTGCDKSITSSKGCSAASSFPEHRNVGWELCVSRGLWGKRLQGLHWVPSHRLEINFHLFLSHSAKRWRKLYFSIYLEVYPTCSLMVARTRYSTLWLQKLLEFRVNRKFVLCSRANP